VIHVELAPEPARFHDEVRAPGLRAVAEMVGKSPPYPRTRGSAYKQRTQTVVEPGGSKRKVLVIREEDLQSSERVFHRQMTISSSRSLLLDLS